VEQEVIFVTLYVNREGIKPIGQSLVSQLLLPRCPLVIEDIVKRRYSVPLLPLIQKVDVCRRWIQPVKLSLGAQNVF